MARRSLFVLFMLVIVGGARSFSSASITPPSPAEVWQSIESPRDGIQAKDGWTFSVASVRPINQGSDALELAFDKARFDAMVRLARTCFDPVQIVGALKAAPAGRLTEQAVFVARDRISLAGVQAIESGVTAKGEARVVIAIPTRTLEAQRLSSADVLEALASRASSDVLPLSLAMLWCELASPEQVAIAREELAESFGREIGNGLAQTIRGEKLDCLSAGWKSLPKPLSEGALGKITLDVALAALARRPHDPTIAEFVAARLMEDGWPACAAAFSEAPELVRWQSMSAESTDPPIALTSPICRLLIETSGKFPLSGAAPGEGRSPSVPSQAIALFNRGKVVEAGNLLVEASPDCPDADWLSYLSACLYQSGMDAEAALMAEVAFDLQPDHPFAGINLLRPLCRMGRLDRARELLLAVESRSALTAWGKRELEVIRLTIDPPAPPPATDPTEPVVEDSRNDEDAEADDPEAPAPAIPITEPQATLGEACHR